MLILFALPGASPAGEVFRFLISRPADGYLYHTGRRRMLPPTEDPTRSWGTVVPTGAHRGRSNRETCAIMGAAVGENSFEEGDYELVVSARNMILLRFAFQVTAAGDFQIGGELGELGELPPDTGGVSQTSRGSRVIE